MKLKPPRSIESWLFLAGAAILLLMTLLYAVVSILATHGQARIASGANLGIAATWLAFQTLSGILELAGLSFLILAAIISIFRTILPSKPK